ncbi:MAG: amidohydrolase [Rhodospirillaceae bacterium]|jgi:aminocarboxymuconate-semialdehyde decarboxylase|nr:amidohydrolase [Rhodospirillaceae bacterium]MBT4115559.1 amidohydrolase [Rhodospirillaceae bacterium]MBT4750681.1 amidohydrolase [Rhodospirillaceae bacterium]MBT6861282.1 amidohydrolase [Rhodospirillaceae bacterium]MBT7031657.1 amidohydrolase [Rhodospirillaceae bacterium]
MTVIDIHTHMFGNAWREMLGKHGKPDYDMKMQPDNREYLMEKGAPACALEVEAFDFDARVKAQNADGIDLGIVSLTSPNVFWGGEDVSVETARRFNDEMAGGQTAYPDRIRWFASLPWEYPDAALAELKRALELGAVGVMVTAHVTKYDLIDPLFAPIWAELDRLALPVLIHPTAPFGTPDANYGRERILLPGLGFMFDTTLAIARMIVDGFFDRYPNVKAIASHAGGYLPYVAGRVDMFFAVETLNKMAITEAPSTYLENIYYDSIVYNPGGLDLCLEVSSPQMVMFGTDFPMPCNIERLKELAGRYPKDQTDAIMSGNAARVFGL